MKLPDLITTVDLYEMLGAEGFKGFVNRWVLIKNVPLNKVIVRPIVSSFDESPSLVISEDMKVACNGMWLVRDNGNSKVYLRDGSELRIDCVVYSLGDGSLLKVCDDVLSSLNPATGDEEILMRGCDDVEVKGLGSSPLVVIRNGGRRYLLAPHFEDKVAEVQDLHYADSCTTALTVFKHRRKYYAAINFKYLNLGKTYELDKCTAVEGVLVGDGLGVVNCSGNSYLISIDEMLKMPLPLEPVAHVHHEYVLYDSKFGVLIRFDGQNFNHLLLLPKPKVVGKLRSGELVVISNGSPYVITGNVFKALAGYRVLNGHADDEYIVLRSLRSLDLYRMVDYISSYRPLECSLIKEKLICIHGGNALIYDLTELHDVDIRIDKTDLSVDSYPILEVTPWSSNSQLTVKGPVTISPEPLTMSPKSKHFNVKPTILGRELTFKATLDAVLAQVAKELKIRASRVELKELVVGEVKHSLNGCMEGTEDNTLVRMRLKVLNPTPEEVQLHITYLEDGGEVLKRRSQALKPGLNELVVADTLKASSDGLRILITYKWFNRNEDLALITLNLREYLVEDPVSSLESKVEVVGSCSSKLVVTPSFRTGVELPVNVSVTCSNNKVFRGVNSVVLNECSLPAVVEFRYGYGGVVWRKYHIMRGESLINVSLSPGDDFELMVNEGSKCVEGFLLNDVDLNVRFVRPVKHILVEPYVIDGNKVGLRLSCSLSAEGTVFALIGGRVTSLVGNGGVLEIDVRDPIINDLKVIVFSGGIKETYSVDNVALIKKYFELGVNTATLLKSRLVVWGGCGNIFGNH